VRLSTGELLPARIVVGADGADSVVAHAALARRARRRISALRAYFEGALPPPVDLEFHLERGRLPGYAWVFPVGGGRANVGVYAESGVRDFYREFTSRSPRLEGARAVRPPVGWPIPVGPSWPRILLDGVLLAGDAASLAEPLFGEGISFALRSGELAAETAFSALREEDVSARRLREHQDRLRAEFSLYQRASVWVRECMRHRPLAAMTVRALARSKTLCRAVLASRERLLRSEANSR
jgi:flavin-dependent dehydrogenase